MHDIEKDEGDEHESGVENVLVSFVDGDAAAVPLRVFDQAEDDTDLENMLVGVCVGG